MSEVFSIESCNALSVRVAVALGTAPHPGITESKFDRSSVQPIPVEDAPFSPILAWVFHRLAQFSTGKKLFLWINRGTTERSIRISVDYVSSLQNLESEIAERRILPLYRVQTDPLRYIFWHWQNFTLSRTIKPFDQPHEKWLKPVQMLRSSHSKSASLHRSGGGGLFPCESWRFPQPVKKNKARLCICHILVWDDSMYPIVSILTELPEALHTSLTHYLEQHPDWDQDQVLTAALSLFLLQNGDCDRSTTSVYLDTLFKHSA